ncbi:MAG: GMC family oxidoreductase [Bacteroidota bacterium]
MLNEKQKSLLIDVVETFVEVSSEKPIFNLPEIANRIALVLNEKSPEEQADFKQLLTLLDSSFLGFTWNGPIRSFSQLNKSQREELFQSWSNSKFTLIRKGYQALKKLCSFIAFSQTDELGNSFSKSITQYKGSPISEKGIPPIQSLQFLNPSSNIRCEVLIIGSGAGGGVAASRFAKAGNEVVIVEKGPWIPESAMSNLEAEMVSQLYEERGALSSADGAMTVFAGACLGGGTTINWQACIKTPEYVLEEWAEESGIEDFVKPIYQKHLQRVWDRIGAGSEKIIHNRNNQHLISGSIALGQEVNEIAKNSSHCNHDDAYRCGWCGFGCKQGNKQSSLKTFIQDATDHGAKILDRTSIDRLIFNGNNIQGAIGIHTDINGKQTHVRIEAKRVIVSAGSIHSPALLLRSGIRHPQLGKNLYLHPVVPVSAIYKETIEAWTGAMMTSTNDEYIRLNGRYGYKIETPPPHPGLLALGMPWKSAKSFQERMSQIQNLGVFIVLSRDQFGGEIKLSRDGRPIIHYDLHPNDQITLMHGMMNAARIHAAAGAIEIALPHNNPTYLPSDIVKNDDKFNAIVQDMRWKKGDFTLFSAHQMGTCRMGNSYVNDVVNPDGKVWGLNGLYVMDASVFPRCSGVNPMISILALSDYMCSRLLGD